MGVIPLHVLLVVVVLLLLGVVLLVLAFLKTRVIHFSQMPDGIFLLLPFHLDAQCSLFSSFLCSLRGLFLTVQKRFSSSFRRGNLFRGSNGGGLSLKALVVIDQPCQSSITTKTKER